MNTKELNLSIEAEERVMEILASTGWVHFIELLNLIKKFHINKIISYDLNNGPEGLVIEKARCEGIIQFIKELELLRKNIIKKDIKG